jgi:adenylosuccinate lyase
MREQGSAGNDLFARLAADERLALTEADLASLVAAPLEFTGAATAQVAAVVAQVDELVSADPTAAAYTPGAIL